MIGCQQRVCMGAGCCEGACMHGLEESMDGRDSLYTMRREDPVRLHSGCPLCLGFLKSRFCSEATVNLQSALVFFLGPL